MHSKERVFTPLFDTYCQNDNFVLVNIYFPTKPSLGVFFFLLPIKEAAKEAIAVQLTLVS